MSKAGDNNELTRTLLAAHFPEYQQRDEIFRATGSIVVSLSDIEGALAIIFAIACLPLNDKKSGAIFFGVPGLDKKVKLVDGVVLLECTAEEIVEWQDLKSEISKKSHLRNKVAHNGLYFFESEEDGSKYPALASSLMNPKEQREKILLKDVEDLAESLLVLEKRIRSFYVKFGRRKGALSEG